MDHTVCKAQDELSRAVVTCRWPADLSCPLSVASADAGSGVRTAAAASSLQIRAGVFISFAGGALIAIAITAWPIIRQYSRPWRSGFVCVRLVVRWFDKTPQCVMLSVSGIRKRACSSPEVRASLRRTALGYIYRYLVPVHGSFYYFSLLRFDLAHFGHSG